jgi:hypothetical protein
MVKPIRKAIRRKPRAPRAPVVPDNTFKAIDALKALQLSGVGRAFEPRDLDHIIALLEGK